MDKQEMEMCASAEDGSHLNRNRSFKSKQLVRSQAIRESTSPPRTVSPSMRAETEEKSVNKVNVKVTSERGSDSSQEGEYGYDRKDRRKPVEIQITQGSWDESPAYSRGRSKRWSSDPAPAQPVSRDLLSYSPRVACVCGTCAACPQCRGRRRRHICTIKQDSGICPDDCPECSDTEPNGNEVRKASSLDADEQYFCRCPERRDKPKNNLSRTDSDDKLEPSGPELVSFIKETLNKNAKDRMTLLKIEKEIHSLINDTGRCIVKFPVMTSYGRMLVHRCASLFQLSHTIDQSNKNCVIVSKVGTSGGRIPCTNFKAWCLVNFPPPSPQRTPSEIIDGANAKSILKRDTHSLDEPSSGALAMNRSKSLEQREKEYERVRRRIFSSDNCNQDESQWPWLSGGPVKLLTPDTGRNKLLKVQSLETSTPQNWRGRGGAVSKSHSFGGYGEPPPARALSRQGDLASSSWRLSPSSSGYKTLSLRSTDSVTPSPTGGGTPEPAAACGPAAVLWAVTDLTRVPPGALVIHPQTGRPLTNADGSVYHFDPTNPPVLYDPADYEQLDQTKIDQTNDKRRGRLEKQHSFIDHEADQQTEPYQYEYEVQESQENPTEKEIPKPSSPKYEQQSQEFNQPEPTNQSEPPPEPANQRPYESANRDVKAGCYQDTVYYGPYASLNQGYSEEVQSPPQMTQYMQPDMTNMQNMQNMLPQAKVSPLIQDPNIRPMSLTNMVYAANIPPGYQYIPNANQCRVEQLQQLYQPMLQQQVEKVPSPPQVENTFRIDPSYPYAPVDYTAAAGYGAGAGAVLEPAPAQPQPQPQRSFSVPFNPEMPALSAAMPPVYPLQNLIQPQLLQYPVPYQDAVQWTPLQTQAMCPVVYPQHYAHYNIVYPQVVPQPYPICQPIYPVLNRKRNSLPSSRVTPITTPEEKPYEKFDRENADIAAKINQIKEGMMQREGVMSLQRNRRDDWKRNSGNGILGSYPVNNYNGRVPGNTDNVQLTSAARAIVNSIRHLQAKNTYHQDRRYDYNNYQRNHERTDYRRRYEDRGDHHGRGDGHNNDRHTNYHDKNNYNDKSNPQERNSNIQDRTGNVQDKPGYNQDRNSYNQDRSNNQDRNSNMQDRACNNLDRNSYNQDRTGNIQDRSNNYRNNYQDTNITQESNTQDINNSYGHDNAQDTSQDNNLEKNAQDTNQDITVQNQNSLLAQSNAQDIPVQGSNVADRTLSNLTDRTLNIADRTHSNVTDRTLSNVTDRTISNVTDRTHSNVVDRTYSNVADRTHSNVTDRTHSNVLERTQSYVMDRTQERNDRSHYQDRNGSDTRTFQDRSYSQDRPWQERKYGPRGQVNQYQYRPPYLFRQMTPGTWCRRSPAPLHPGINHPRRPHPDNRNARRY